MSDSPYDLVPVNVIMPQDTEELALTLNGKKRKIAIKDFLAFGKTLSLSERQIQKAIERIMKSVSDSLTPCLNESFMPMEMQEQVHALITSRMTRLCKT